MSYGGSHTLTTLVAVGLLLGIHRRRVGGARVVGLVGRAGAVLRAVRPSPDAVREADEASSRAAAAIHLLPGDAASVTRLRGSWTATSPRRTRTPWRSCRSRRDTDLTIGAAGARRPPPAGRRRARDADRRADAERAGWRSGCSAAAASRCRTSPTSPPWRATTGAGRDRRDPAPPGRRGHRGSGWRYPGLRRAIGDEPHPPPRQAVRRHRRAALPGRRHARHHPHPDPPGRRARGHVRVPLRSRTCARRARPVRGGVRLARDRAQRRGPGARRRLGRPGRRRVRRHARGRRGGLARSRVRSRTSSRGSPWTPSAPPSNASPAASAWRRRTTEESVLTKQILVSVDRAETRVAIMEDGRAAECYIERRGQRSVVGHVWKGRVENVLAGMEAAFIEIGLEKNGFLHVDEVVALGVPKRKRQIADLLKRGDEVLVQATKDPMGTQGRPPDHAALPGGALRGVRAVRGRASACRKRLPDDERTRLRSICGALPLETGRPHRPHRRRRGLGARDRARPGRSSSACGRPSRSAAELAKAPTLLYSRGRHLPPRDPRPPERGRAEVLVDDEAQFERIQGFLRRTSPEMADRVRHWTRTSRCSPRTGVEASHPLHHGAPRAAAVGRLPGDRRHRGDDRHRRQHRPQRRQGRQPPRGHDHQDQPRGGGRGGPPAAPAQHRRHHHHRLHRHGRRAQPRAP